MGLVVNEDSYISVADADVYVENYYSNKPDVLTKWNTLSVQAKESLLRDSTRSIDTAFKFRGRKRKVAQRLQFPRYNQTYFGVGFGYVTNQLFDNELFEGNALNGDGGLRRAREATVENAIACMLYTRDADTVMHNTILGITSQKIGSISETYNANNQESRATKYGIYCYEKIVHLLIGWVNGNHISV